MAVWQNGRVEVCPNEQGNRITPSYVAFLPDETRLVGDTAKNQASQNPAKLTFFVIFMDGSLPCFYQDFSASLKFTILLLLRFRSVREI